MTRRTPLAVSPLLAALFLPTLFSSSTPAQTQLRWRLAPNEKLQLVLSQKSSTAAEIAGLERRSTLTAGATLEWRVVDVDARGVAAIDQTLTRLTLTAQLPGAPAVRYDPEEQPPSSPQAKAIADEFRPFIGKTVRISLTPEGRITKAPRAAVGAATGAATNESAWTSRDVQQMLGYLLPPLPAEGGAIGATWEDRRESMTPHGPIFIEARLTRGSGETEQGRALEKIEADYTLASKVQEQGVDVEFAEQANHGVFLFDAAGGRLVRGEVNQVLTMRVTVEEAQVSQKVTSVQSIEVRGAP